MKAASASAAGLLVAQSSARAQETVKSRSPPLGISAHKKSWGGREPGLNEGFGLPLPSFHPSPHENTVEE